MGSVDSEEYAKEQAELDELEKDAEGDLEMMEAGKGKKKPGDSSAPDDEEESLEDDEEEEDDGDVSSEY